MFLIHWLSCHVGALASKWSFSLDIEGGWRICLGTSCHHEGLRDFVLSVLLSLFVVVRPIYLDFFCHSG